MKHTPKIVGPYTIMPTGEVISRTGWRCKESKSIIPIIGLDGYLEIRLSLNGKRKKWKVHTMIAELFLGHRPTKSHQVRHLDGNIRNNSVENLAWGTAKENAKDRELHGRTSRGGRHSDAIKKAIAQSKIDHHLIAAAPDMLEVLEDLYRLYRDDSQLMHRAANIIQKAKGEL